MRPRFKSGVHFGIVSPPVPGHIHPFGALGRELIARGHRVTFLQMADVQSKVVEEGLEFLPIGASDHPPGSLPQSLERLGRLKGLAALRFTIDAVRKTTIMFCRDAPDAIRQSGIEMLLVDQTEPAGGTVAEHLGLPFVTICCALALNRDNSIPPPFTPWRYSSSRLASARNFAGYEVSSRIMSPVTGALAAYRSLWKLPAHRSSEDSYSRTAQISQQPPAFDFPRKSFQPAFHYVGPLRREGGRNASFPWERLNGKPTIYASLGTLQHSKTDVFRIFAEACAGLDAQLVLSHCGALSDTDAAALPGNPIVVPYAPQTDLLRVSRLALTHAGLNTVLDALTFGVPVVAIPITYEQPAIASRIKWCGAGLSIRLADLNAERLQAMIKEVLANPRYAQKAAVVSDSIRTAGGVQRAAGIIEQAVQADRSNS